MSIGNMTRERNQRLVEICPQCLHGVNETNNRLVSDACGHMKCRICLIQEAHGCIKCNANCSLPKPSFQPPRKTVITSTQQFQAENPDKGTCKLLQKSLEKDALFPTDLVKRDKGNCYHLKRLISERYFNEEGCNKEDKCCGTEDLLQVNEQLSSLPRHIKYFCVIHNMQLTERNSLNEHSSCSEKDCTFKCLACNLVFENNYKLNRHNRSHKPTSKYQCDICLKRFKDNYALKTHSRKHSGDKVFSCNFCDVKLSQLWSLKRHLAKHTGERNFVCEVCDFRFLTKSELRRHMASHLKLKSYICRKCGAKFSCQRSLKRHAVAHSDNVAILHCDQCESTFNRKDNLLRHLKHTHSADATHCE